MKQILLSAILYALAHAGHAQTQSSNAGQIKTPTYGQPKYGAPKDSANFEASINPDLFLAGTFSDYLGRFQYIDKATQIDKYYPYEEPLANYIGNFINKHYGIKADPKFEGSRHSIILSPTLASRLHNEYFDAKGSFLYGKLDTEEKKYSFLAGVFYRFGEQLDENIYKLQLANSPKAKHLYQLLNDLDCDKIVHKFLRGYIPSSDIYYFVATPRMVKYFNTIREEKAALQQSFYNNIPGKPFEGEQGKAAKEIVDKERKELVRSLHLIFD